MPDASVISPRVVQVYQLGRQAYEPTWDLQRQLQSRLIEAKRKDPPDIIPHYLLLVEHPPVYTLGKSGKTKNLLRSETELSNMGATFIPIDRGGDITFHGPGQLVGYPILDLDRFFTDIGRYLRLLEDVIIDTCTDYGLQSGRIAGRTGVWIGPDEKGPERKICAMGIRCSRWVTMHGFALNMNTDLRFFEHIVPCGISDRGVTSLATEIGRPVDETWVQERVIDHFSRHFEAPIDLLKDIVGIESIVSPC